MPITNNGKKPYVTFENWDAGIADDVYSGYNLIKDISVKRKGIASVGVKPTGLSVYKSTGVVVTADASTDKLTSLVNWTDGSNNVVGIAFTIASTGTLPAGLSANTVYYTGYVSGTEFKVSTSMVNADAGTYVDITDAGTGTHTVTFINMGRVSHFAKDYRVGSDTTYVLDANGRVWVAGEGSTTFRLIDGNPRGGSDYAYGNGIAVWKDYLLVFRNTKIDAWGPLSSAFASRAWDAGIVTLQTNVGNSPTLTHTAIVGQDDILYYIDGRYIGSINEVSGQTFDPGTPATFNANVNALDLPVGTLTYDIEEYGRYIVTSAVRDKISYIYPWDRTSSSINLPIEIPETNPSHLVNINNVLYCLTNGRPAIYATNLSSVQLIRSIPQHLAGEDMFDNTLSITCATKMGGEIFFGMTAGGSGTTSANTGVYAFNPANNSIRLENTMTTGNNSYQSSVGAVFPFNFLSNGFIQYFFSFYNGTYYGVEFVNEYPYNNYEAEIITPFIVLDSNVYDNRHISEVVFYLAQAIGGSDAIKLQYRTEEGATWTDVATVTSAESGISPMVRVPCSINENHLQFRISLSSNNTTGYTYVRLRKVEII
jgi:hypothetical protein